MNILISGGSRGIGRELVLEFSKNTDNNIVVISRDTEKLIELQKTCFENYNNKITIYSLDFLADEIDEKIEFILKEQSKHFHIVINNAGTLINKPFNQTTIKEWKKVFDVNLFAPVLLVQAILKSNSANQDCHIINISSMGGVQGSLKFPGLSAYSASKSALINLTECLAEELKDSQTKINSLALGAVQTEMLKEAFPDYLAGMSPKEMAKFIAKFSIEDNAFFNGKVIPVALTTP